MSGENLVSLPIYDAIRACERCALRQEAKHPIPPEGCVTSPVLFLGQNPGDDEERANKVFVGRSGKELDEWFTVLQIDRKKVGLANIVHCFPGDTMVTARGVSRGYRRYYSGEMVHVRTNGNDLTGTPNHPILTSRGWVPMHAVRAGDYLISASVSERVPGRDPHVDEGPARFDEMFESLSDEGARQRVVGCDVDFHGDGKVSEIDVVGAEGLLRKGHHAARREHFVQESLEPADVHEAALCARRATLTAVPPRLGAFGFAPDGGVGISNHTLPCTLTHSSPARTVAGACGGASLRRPAARISNGDAVGNEYLSDPVEVGGVALDSDGLDTAACSVGSADTLVAEVQRFTWAGHVFNLETASGEYTANGFIVHNCHTTKNRTPRVTEVKFCRDLWLPSLIEAMPNLQVIIPMGKPAQSAVLTKIAVPLLEFFTGRVRWQEREFTVYPIVHPAYVLRSPNERDRQHGVLRQVRDHLAVNSPHAYAAVA